MNDTLLRRLVLPVAIAAALLGAACSDGDDDDGSGPALVDIDSGGDEPADTTAPPDDREETTESPAEGDDDIEDTGGESLGTTTGQHPDHFGGDILVPLRIDVTSLERNGELVELTMTLTNEHENESYNPLTEYRESGTPGNEYDISGVRLIDQGERVLYLPVLDSENVCLCSNGLDDVEIPAGDSYDLHATFGGIPDSVTTLDLEVPGFSPIAGLEVQG